MEEEDFGEDIWNALSWRAGIAGKIVIMKKHFAAMAFIECQKNVLEFIETYFVAFYEEQAAGNVSGLSVELRNGNVLQTISEEFFFGCLDDVNFTSIQELKLLELLCLYFEGEKMDPVRFLVFQCLFGNIVGNDIKEILREIKINFLGKLMSMAVSMKCKLLLEFCAILFQDSAFWEKALRIFTNVINDFCFLVPSGYHILKGVVEVSPSFACALTEAAPCIYSFNEKKKKDNADDDSYVTQKGLPPISLLTIIGSWLIEHVDYGVAREPHQFFSLPSIYNGDDKKPRTSKCSIIGVLHWSVLTPLFTGVSASSLIKHKLHYSSSGNSAADATQIRNASSQLHFGVLNFFGMQRRIESSSVGDDDDLEPGEVAEVAKQINLIDESNIKEIIASLDQTVEKHKDDITEEELGESIDRLAQIIQVSKWSGCLTPTSKKFKHSLKKLPKTKLFSKVLKTL